jgi:hypothetical protein
MWIWAFTFSLCCVQVTIAERPKLKYTEAVLLEVMRCCDSAVTSAPHTATFDGATFRGYDIPR